MTDTPQPTSGSLNATIIRKCSVHRTCPLTCKQRKVEDLGEIAAFRSLPKPTLPNPSVGLKTGKPSQPTILERAGAWLKQKGVIL